MNHKATSGRPMLLLENLTAKQITFIATRMAYRPRIASLYADLLATRKVRQLRKRA
jgi:hypothetical protein